MTNGSTVSILLSENMNDITFSGDGYKNNVPALLGAERLVEKYWVQEGSNSAHTTWKIGSSRAVKEGTEFTITVYFDRQRYNGTSWVTIGQESARFTLVNSKSGSTSGNTDDSTGSGGSGSGSGSRTGSGSSGSDSSSASGKGSSAAAGHSPTVTGGAAGSSQVGNARTGDSAPVATMLLLGAMSMLTGGYVIVRRRKKEI